MSVNPFVLNPTRAELGKILARMHEKILEEILRAVCTGGIAVLEGDPGTGKTTLLHVVSRRLTGERRVSVIPVYVPCGGLVRSEEDLLRAILDGLYIGSDGGRMELYRKLRDLQSISRERIAVLLDDVAATPISMQPLGECIRMISDLPNFSVVMAGEPKFIEKMLRSNRALQTRVICKRRLGRARFHEIVEMLQKRANLVGLRVSERAARLLYSAGGGIPREVLKAAMEAYDFSQDNRISFEKAVEKLCGRKIRRRKARRRQSRKS